jgi:superoxide dismutase
VFGTFDPFKAKYVEAGSNHFCSGWVFLVTHGKGEGLQISTLPNQDSLLPLENPGVWRERSAASGGERGMNHEVISEAYRGYAEVGNCTHRQACLGWVAELDRMADEKERQARPRIKKWGLQGIEWVVLRGHSGGKACGHWFFCAWSGVGIWHDEWSAPLGPDRP